MLLRIVSLFFIINIFTTSLSGQELTMFTGLFGYEFYQDDKKIDRKYATQLMSDVDASRLLWKKANLNQGIGLGLLGAEVGFGVWMIRNSEKNESITVPTIGFAATAISALVLAIRSMTHRRNAILSYNRSFDRTGFKYQIEPSREGLGVVIRF